MSKSLVCDIVIGCVLGVSLGVAMLYGLVELADWFMEHT